MTRLAALSVFLCAVAASADTKAELSKAQAEQLEKAARDYFDAPADKQADWRFDAKLDALLDREPAARRAVWKAYQASTRHASVKKDFAADVVRHHKLESPYTVKKVGKRPANGWPLFIAMHGGGGVPRKVNDSQWKVMQSYYRDQASVTGYQYLALRAPNDTWNGFYYDGILPLIENLIRQFTLFGDVDPDRVYLMGYSHGGYGAFFIGPKMPDRFAAVHVSAAAPTDGTISARTLRNTAFTFMIGEKDTDYGRLERCKKFDEVVGKLKKDNPDAYPVKMELMKGHGHGGLPDRDKIKSMYEHERKSTSATLDWELTDEVVRHFYWLGVPKPARGQSIVAKRKGNAFEVTTRGVKELELHLDGRLVRFDEALKVTLNGKEKKVEAKPSLAALCRSLLERGDIGLAWTCAVKLKAGE
jgi:hypothetical protein